MPSGSCLCGKVGYSYSGEPAMKALCHCSDCQKISGTHSSTNIAVPDTELKFTGTPKQYTKKGDSGNEITSHFCADCGCTLVRTGSSFPGLVIVKVGSLDDPGALDKFKPELELFAPRRTAWVAQVQGTQDQQAMPA